MPAVQGVTSGFLVLIVPDTHMSVYLQLRSGFYLGLCRYEGIWAKRYCPGCCVCTKNVGETLSVYKRCADISLSVYMFSNPN